MHGVWAPRLECRGDARWFGLGGVSTLFYFPLLDAFLQQHMWACGLSMPGMLIVMVIVWDMGGIQRAWLCLTMERWRDYNRLQRYYLHLHHLRLSLERNSNLYYWTEWFEAVEALRSVKDVFSAFVFYCLEAGSSCTQVKYLAHKLHRRKWRN